MIETIESGATAESCAQECKDIDECFVFSIEKEKDSCVLMNNKGKSVVNFNVYTFKKN